MSFTAGNDSSLKRTFLEMQNEISFGKVFPQRHHHKKFSSPVSLSQPNSQLIAICPKERTVGGNLVISDDGKEHSDFGYGHDAQKNDVMITDSSMGDHGLDILTKNVQCVFERERFADEVDMKDSSKDPSEKVLNEGSQDVALELSQLEGLYLRTF